MPRDLADIQTRFRAAVLGGESAGLAGVVGDTARLAVHRNTVQTSLINVLATAFPVTQRIVGANLFTQLARTFILAAPPHAPQLSLYGDAFAAFLDRDAIARRLPYAPDVARLEWARGESYFAADAPPVNMTKLASLSPHDMDHTVLRVHPATRLVSSAFPIHRIWEAHQPAATNVPLVDMNVAQDALVSRNGHHIVTRAISGIDAAFLSAVMQGQTLSQATTDVPGDFDLQQALQDHFLNGTFQDF